MQDTGLGAHVVRAVPRLHIIRIFKGLQGDKAARVPVGSLLDVVLYLEDMWGGCASPLKGVVQGLVDGVILLRVHQRRYVLFTGHGSQPCLIVVVSTLQILPVHWMGHHWWLTILRVLIRHRGLVLPLIISILLNQGVRV